MATRKKSSKKSAKKSARKPARRTTARKSAKKSGKKRWAPLDPKQTPYIPTPPEIAAACERIREEGFTDFDGNLHPPWTEEDHRRRRGSTVNDLGGITFHGAEEATWDVPIVSLDETQPAPPGGED